MRRDQNIQTAFQNGETMRVRTFGVKLFAVFCLGFVLIPAMPMQGLARPTINLPGKYDLQDSLKLTEAATARGDYPTAEWAYQRRLGPGNQGLWR